MFQPPFLHCNSKLFRSLLCNNRLFRSGYSLFRDSQYDKGLTNDLVISVDSLLPVCTCCHVSKRRGFRRVFLLSLFEVMQQLAHYDQKGK
ncbi:hypothetical protein CMV_020310 [Castanea mollissima]|uniref:Uncharacterized protein n=1 Tax=Castanea mollissima TaxID=60419 RepID=A0A8J4VAH3_9ROSI|nr:hypothetical protein CMV_020310 [Castanea mollissima]